MASPHTAGLLAYLLSIYPSYTFNPSTDASLVAPSFDASYPAPSMFKNVYASAFGCMPGFLTQFLPSPSLLEEVAPTPPSIPTILTPTILKKALLALSTPGKLKGMGTDLLPVGTPNKLIFNNATDASGKNQINEAFWASLY